MASPAVAWNNSLSSNWLNGKDQPLLARWQDGVMKVSITVPYPESRQGEWSRFKKRPPVPSEEQIRAWTWSKRAVGEAWGRCGNNSGDSFKTWTAAVEGVWWVLALDEELFAHLGHPYAEARSTDPCGQIVRGMKWLRNRHAHEIMITGHGGVKKPFFGTPGSIVFISPSNRWKTSTAINPQRDETPEEYRERYDEHLAGLPLDHSLYQATIWFDRVFSACGFPDLQSPQDPTVL